MIAGPCAVENADQVFKVAKAVAASGAKFFRGGAFKPRTSPYAFQGMGEDGLKILADVRSEYDLNIVTEAMDERGIDLVEKYGDCIQNRRPKYAEFLTAEICRAIAETGPAKARAFRNARRVSARRRIHNGRG